MTVSSYMTKKGKRYRFTTHLGIDYQGKPVQKTMGGFLTAREAKSAESEAMYQYDREIVSIARSRPYKEVYDEWVMLYKDTVKESTFNKTKGLFERRILPVFGHLDLNRIDTDICQQFVTEMSRIYKNYNAVYNYASLVYEFAYKKDYTDQRNPFDKVILPTRKWRTMETTETPFLNVPELMELLEAMKKNKRWYTYFYILAFTGIRRGEGLALKFSDIQENVMRIRRTLTAGEGNKQYVTTPKTRAGIRDITLDDKTLAVIKDYQKTVTTDDMFTTKDGELVSLSKPYQFLKRILKTTDLPPVTVHSFRHTHCSMLFESGWSVKEVQQRLGWSDIQTCLNVYYHVTDLRKEESVRSFTNYIDKTMEKYSI